MRTPFATPTTTTPAGSAARSRPHRQGANSGQPLTTDRSSRPIIKREARLAELAAAQHGAVHRHQLTAIGLDNAAIDRRRRAHRLHPMSADVFAVGHPRLSRHGRGIAALLQVGDGGCLSHESAARVWDLVDTEPSGPIHLSSTTGSQAGMPAGAILHRPRTLAASDIVTHRGVAVTTPERTLRDLLATSDVVEITRILERMVTLLGRSPDDLHAWGRDLGRVKGKRKLLRALDNVVGPVVLRSLLETEFRALCDEAGFPLPETNVRLGLWEVDVLWRELRLIVELDSWRFHGGQWAFHRDRRKGLALAADGHEVLRLTWAQVKYDRAAVIEALAAVIARRTPAT